MSGQWITYWIDNVIERNQNTTYGDALKAAFDGHNPMLAGIVRLKLATKSVRMRFVFQQYVPPSGPNANSANVDPTHWGSGWGY